MMHVLITGNFYAPEETGIAPYTTGLAEHLAARGARVTVITSMPSYPQWQVYPEYRGKWRAQEVRNGVVVRRVRSYIPRGQSTIRRGLYEASFLFGGLTSLGFNRPDVVLGVAPALSGGVLARVAATRFTRPYGVILQDLTGPAAGQTGVAATRSVRPITDVEGWVARGAAAVGIIADGFRFYLESLGVEPARIRRIRNWTRLEKPKLDRPETRARLCLPDDAIICLHAGNMGYKQGLINVVESARLAVDSDPRILFVLMGDGSQRALLVELRNRYQLPNLVFRPIQPAELLPSVLAAADVLLLNQLASVTNMALPSKLTSYFAAGRPVLAAVTADSEAAREIEAAEAGIVVPPEEPELLLGALRDLVTEPTRQHRLGEAGKRYARSALSAGQALASIEELIEVAINADARSTRPLV